MTFGEFLHRNVNAGAVIKAMWPERGKSATGFPADFKSECSMLNAKVIDMLITSHDNTSDYDVMLWLSTKDEPRI